MSILQECLVRFNSIPLKIIVTVAALPFFTDALLNMYCFLHARTNERKKMQRLRKKRGGGFVEKKKQKTEEEAEIDMSEYCVLKCAALGA